MFNYPRDFKYNPDVIANEVNKFLKYPKDPLKIAIIVEGTKDCEIFEKFFNKLNCKFFSTKGKEGVEKVVRNDLFGFNPHMGYHPNFKKHIIGIIDVDLDFLYNKKNLEDGTIFTTLVHDMDIAMIESRALENFLQELTDPKKRDQFLQNQPMKNFRDVLYHEGMYFGLARFINQKERFEIEFDNLKNPEKMIPYIRNQSIPFFDEKSVIQILFSDGINCNKNEKEFFETFKKYLKNKEKFFLKPQNLCQGHDIFCLLLCIFKERIGKDTFRFNSIDSIEEFFRNNCYKGSDFKETKLCKNLKNWELNNHKDRHILFTANIYNNEQR